MPFLALITRSARATALWTRVLGALAALLLVEPATARPLSDSPALKTTLAGCCTAPWLHSSDCRQLAQTAPPDAENPPETKTPVPAAEPVSPEMDPAPDTPSGPIPEAPTAGETYPRLIHNGQIQFQFDEGSLGSPRPTSPFPSSNGIGPFPAANHLFVRRFRPAFNLAMSPSFDLQTEFNIDPHSERIQVLDVRFNYDLSEHTYVSAGRYKVPFGWEGLRSSRSTNTIERSDMTSALYPERDVGFSVTHRQPRLGQFSVGTFLGQARSNGASNGQLDLLGRALFRINDDLKLGVSGHTGTFRPSAEQRDLPVRRVGTELQYSSGPWKVEGEAMWSDGYNTISRDDTQAAGFYAAAIYRIADPLDLVVQYDRFDPDTGYTNSLFADNASNARDRKVVGLNYYLDRDLMHRIMVNYEWKQDLEGPSLHTQGFRVRYQLAW